MSLSQGMGRQIWWTVQSHGGAALYRSLAPKTALRAANHGGMLQPTMLVAYEADIEPLRDGRDAAALQPFGIAPAQLADPS